MHEIKIRNFVRENPDTPFPPYASLTAEEAYVRRDGIAARLGLAANVPPVELARGIAERQGRIAGIDASAESNAFDLLELFARLGIAPREQLYINWRHFVEVDRLATSDVARYFDLLWYPGPDEIDLFDDSLSWLLSIDYDGCVACWIDPGRP